MSIARIVIPKSLMTVLLSGPLLAVVTAPLAAPRPAQAAPASTLVVDDGSDVASCSGFLTLRCAIIAANGAPFTNIRFAPGLPAVLLTGPLPTITGDGTWIDGHDISNGCVCPRLDGAFWTAATGSALTINANYVTVSNIRIVNIPSDGADISIIGGKNIEISYDDLGLLPGATQCPAFASTVGVSVAGDNTGIAGPNNGVAYIYGDTISCHGGSGVEVISSNYVYVGTQRDSTTPFGNHIGTTSDGTRAAGNGYAGVRVANSDQVTIRANLIAHNANAGVTVAGTNVDVAFNTLSENYWGLAISGGSTQTIIGNNVGTSADGLSAWPNTHEGIFISGGTGLFLSDNVVANNGGAGIAVIGNATQALIENNNIANNGGLPIDLGDDGPTRNGQFFPPGPNAWQAYPVVTAASGNLIQGTACPSCAVYVYRALGNPGQPRGGGVFLSINTFANTSGQWSATLPAGVTVADVTLTAFSPAGDSSEMSPRPQLFLPLIRH
jgi:hypothetical protein